MFIITVFPITRGAFKERLTYWSAEHVSPGSIIHAPLRNGFVPALVETIQDATEAKTEIKNASFMTRKLERTTEYMLVHPECIKAAELLSKYYASPLGPIVKALIPEIVLSESVNQKPEKESTPKPKRKLLKDPEMRPEILTFQSNDLDRYSTYKGIVREEFARKKSVILIVPTIAHAEKFGEILKKGIEDYVIVLHGSLTKKNQKLRWDIAIAQPHPIVIVATSTFMSVPRNDISTIIIDRESSRSYVTAFPPYIDYRTYIEFYAQEIGAKLILCDVLLRVETLYRREKGEVTDLFQPTFRMEGLPETIIVDMAEPARKTKDGFQILSEELVSMIEYTEKRQERMFIFAARRGLSPQAVCGDCGKTVTCDHCSAPVVLHNSKQENNRYFLCHHCGHKRSALETCRGCGSWKLTTLGIGIDGVYDQIEKKFPNMKLFKIDRDTVSTDKKAKDIIKQFENSKGAILVGTEAALTFLGQTPHVAVASMDSLFSLPDFRVNERIAHILLRLLSRTIQYLLIQTRNANMPVLKQITSGVLADFYREELSVRQAINYPPFAVQIKITIESERDTAAQEMERLQHILQQWAPMIFPAFIPTVRGKAVLHMLISVPPERWPDHRLRETLVALPKEFVVKVNPESLL